MNREKVLPVPAEEIGRFFSSNSIALIGASPKDDRIYPNLRKFFNGKVYPVNPKYSEVYGLPCYQSLKEAPGDVECAAVMVPRDSVLQVLEDCGRSGVRYAVVFAAGFSELGEEGKRMEARMREIAREFSMIVVGPNSSGFINTEGLSPCWLPNMPVPSSTSGVGIISQSGGMLSNVYRLGVLRKLGFSYMISSGNDLW
jgi:acetyltransferase